MRTMAGLFDTYQDAERAVDALQNIGISRDKIGVVARDMVLRERLIGAEDQATAEGAGTGAVGGTAVGGLVGLLAGLSAITVPGLGPIITAGTIATAFGTAAAGAGLGAATGGIIGALTSTGIPEPDAQVYAESVKRGGLLLTVDIEDEQTTPVLESLEQANAVDIAVRREELRHSGWEQFDDTSTP